MTTVTTPRVERGIRRELSQALVLLALSGSCFGGLAGMVAVATRALAG